MQSEARLSAHLEGISTGFSEAVNSQFYLLDIKQVIVNFPVPTLFGMMDQVISKFFSVFAVEHVPEEFENAEADYDRHRQDCYWPFPRCGYRYHPVKEEVD
jgi:hypothetical protein